jgi:hypothetical protein
MDLLATATATTTMSKGVDEEGSGVVWCGVDGQVRVRGVEVCGRVGVFQCAYFVCAWQQEGRRCVCEREGCCVCVLRRVTGARRADIALLG